MSIFGLTIGAFNLRIQQRFSTILLGRYQSVAVLLFTSMGTFQ